MWTDLEREEEKENDSSYRSANSNESMSDLSSPMYESTCRQPNDDLRDKMTVEFSHQINGCIKNADALRQSFLLNCNDFTKCSDRQVLRKYPVVFVRITPFVTHRIRWLPGSGI